LRPAGAGVDNTVEAAATAAATDGGDVGSLMRTEQEKLIRQVGRGEAGANQKQRAQRQHTTEVSRSHACITHEIAVSVRSVCK
jgi:hypothetical protein